MVVYGVVAECFGRVEEFGGLAEEGFCSGELVCLGASYACGDGAVGSAVDGFGGEEGLFVWACGADVWWR